MGIIAKGTLSADGSTTAVEVGTKKEYSVGLRGTFGSGSVVVEISVDGGSNYISTGSAGTLTAAGWVRVFPPTGSLVRLTLSGATAPTIAWTINE